MYSFKSKVRYSETNEDGMLDITSIINYFQDCSTFQSESLNLGVDYLKKENKAWVLNSWQVEFLKDISFMENIEIGTWSYGSKGVYGFRNFVMNNKNDERCVNANSLWVLINIETGKPLRVKEEDISPYGNEPQIEMVDYGRKIELEGEAVSQPPFDVCKSHIDTNGHVNNSKYIQFAMEYVNDANKIKALRVEYKKSAVYGDTIYPYTYEDKDKLTVSLNDSEGNTFSKVQLIFKER